MESIRVTAKTLDEAITKACVDLGVTSEMLDYKIIETGSNGVFGFGARPYVIEAASKEEREEEEIFNINAEKTEHKKPEVKRENKRPEKKHKTSKPEKKEAPAKSEQSSKEEKPVREEKHSEYLLSETEVNAAGEKAVAFLKDVLSNMGVKAELNYKFDEARQELFIDISGDDMGVLIGKRGQTLDALQYITGQVINKHQNNYVRVKIDTENYRERRKETLETLAENIAHKVKRTKRPVALEPMNPYERRIIHSSLQGEKDVTTRSEGEEPYRHVVVCPAKHKN